MFRKEIIFRMHAIEREYRAADLATGELLKKAVDDPTTLYFANLAVADVRACRQNSEITYLVRMFAVFEEALREVRRIVYGRSNPIRTYDLLQQFAARQYIPHAHLANAHAVRDYRNSVIHGGDAQAITTRDWRIYSCRLRANGWHPSGMKEMAPIQWGTVPRNAAEITSANSTIG